MKEAPLLLFSMVQWQHSDTAVWHDIVGWQSALDGNMRQAWWVGSEHFGSDPHRWQLCDEEGGNLLSNRDLFTMPEQLNQILRISVPVSD
ncbi:MAG: hypothetical protein GY805_37460 [Chloroflexi bacterium]|nr:hypothetical protein [Chloroflexota bacterium]